MSYDINFTYLILDFVRLEVSVSISLNMLYLFHGKTWRFLSLLIQQEISFLVGLLSEENNGRDIFFFHKRMKIRVETRHFKPLQQMNKAFFIDSLEEI